MNLSHNFLLRFDKFTQKYHPYIVDLIINSKVDIQGFDYEYNPEDDFQIGDLSDGWFELC